MHGDYDPWSPYIGQGSSGYWDFHHVYDEADLQAMNGTWGKQEMDFIDEIRQYFAEIFSRDSLKTGYSKEGGRHLDGKDDGVREVDILARGGDGVILSPVDERTAKRGSLPESRHDMRMQVLAKFSFKLQLSCSRNCH